MISYRTTFCVVLLTFFTIISARAQSHKKKVLFLGNSYTYVNNLPQMIADAASSTGDTLIFDSYTPGGYTLLAHSTDTTSLAKIAQGTWDYVVLQEQSQLPSFQDYSQFSIGARDVCSYINKYNPCARTMFYMTWGRQNGDTLNCPVWPPVCTYQGMDSLLHLRYMEVALNNNAGVSPVGAVWKYVRQNFPGIVLYQSDGSHPSVAGTYIAACCFYTALFKKDPTLITFNSSLTQAEASQIKSAAKIIVFDSLQNWHYGKKLPIAGFNYIVANANNQVSFINTSHYAESYLWDFGDGSSSTDENPLHNYLSNGTYSVTLTASNCDSSQTHHSIFQRNIGFCSYTPTIFPDSLILCSNSNDTLWTQTYDSYQWYNANGDVIPGATNRYYVVSSDSLVNGGKKYSVLTTKNSCSEMSTQALASLYNINFYISTGYPFYMDTICLGDTLKIFLKLFSAVQSYTIQWLNNGIPVPSATTDTIVVTASGSYSASVITSDCPAMAFQSVPLKYTFVNCNSVIIENFPQPLVFVYPNPAETYVKVKINSSLVGTNYEILNILGRVIRTGKFDKEINSIEINDFNSGIYILQIGKTKKQVIKLVKI